MHLPVFDLFDFLRGPGFIISVTVFFSGLFWRTILMIRATHNLERNRILTGNTVPDLYISANTDSKKKLPSLIGIKMRNTIFFSHPIMGVVSLIFHLLLFITPLFLSAHNIIADMTIGFSLSTLPEQLTDIFTVILIAACGFFMARRILISQVRIITTLRDYLILFIVMMPLISGFMAYHHFFNYRIIVYAHMIIGETAIIVAPFTSLAHMPFAIFSRFFIDGEYTFLSGSRRW